MKQKMTSKRYSTAWIIDFSTSSKMNFGLVKRQKMSSQCLATTRKFAFWFTLVAFWSVSEVENELKVPCEPLKHRFLDLTQIAFWTDQEFEYEFALPGKHLKYSFINLTKVAFCAVQEEVNDFKVPLDHLKHRFIDFVQVEFWASKEAENDS